MANPFGQGPYDPFGGQQQRPFGNQLPPNFGGGGFGGYGGPPQPRRRRGSGLAFALICLVTLVIVGGFVGVFFFAFGGGAEKRINEEIEQAIGNAGAGTTSSTAGGKPSSSGGGGGGAAAAANWTEAGNVKKALASMQKEAGPGTKVALMRVDARQVWCSCGNAKFSGTLQVTDAGTRVVNSGGAITSTLLLEDVDPKAPERMIAALKKTGVAASEVDYMSLLDFAGEPRWGLFLKTTGATPAKMYAADGDGRNFRKNG